MQSISEFVRPYWVVWLMGIFLGILFWALRPKNKDRFEQDAQIPLKDDD
ncbi:MAG: cbb3-type cytochrome c oxidase subunit 3 [Alphaproteobacteria bacterium]|nr:cbb3-type cytochrome c oxidase subunit 3 [Rhodospirillales bacterium]MCW9045478.1 cbb3-type cytochrome c oxidase subunit 3 [Alphaproteobacteria bacterium]